MRRSSETHRAWFVALAALLLTGIGLAPLWTQRGPAPRPSEAGIAASGADCN